MKEAVKKKMHDLAFKKAAKERRGKKMTKTISLEGKKAVIFGVATDKSIAFSVAKTLADNGCKLALGYQERAGEYVKELAKELNDPYLAPCDMVADEFIENFFEKIKADFLVS